MNRLKALWGKRIGGVPVPVIFVVLVVAAWLVMRRRQARQASDVQPDPATVDASTPVGAMMGDGSGATGYDAPQPYGGAYIGPFENPSDIADLFNPDAGDTTASGGHTGSTGTPGKKVPPKKKSHHSAHKAGHHKPPKKGAHPHAAEAPAKKTTVHKAAKTANPRKPARPTKAQAAHAKATHPRKHHPRRRRQP